MSAQNDRSGTDHEEAHHLAPPVTDRRSFVRGALVSGSAAASLVGLAGSHVSMARAQGLQPVTSAGPRKHYHIPASDKTVHWGYFSKALAPVVEVESGDFVTIETLTHHANDDSTRMIQDDPGAESVYHWDAQKKNVNRRGAGPMDASLFGRGAGEGLGVHILTGPLRCAAPSKATCWRCAFWMPRRDHAPIPSTPARASAATPPPGGASTTRTCSRSRSRAR
jgi:hypothetical protein